MQMSEMLQSKDTGYLNRQVNKTLTHATCKRLTSDGKTHTDESKEMGREFTYTVTKLSGVAIRTPYKMDFQRKAVTRDKEGLGNSTSRYLFEETQALIWKDTRIRMFTTALFTIASYGSNFSARRLMSG